MVVSRRFGLDADYSPSVCDLYTVSVRQLTPCHPIPPSPLCFSPRYTCRTLFERHKLLFSFHMCAKILETSGKLNMDEYNFFLRGGVVSWSAWQSKVDGSSCDEDSRFSSASKASLSDLRKNHARNRLQLAPWGVWGWLTV